jgi:hypothetical protein
MKSNLILFLVVVILLLAGCSPGNKLRRAERLIKKAELAGSFWHSDTVKVTIPVFVDRIALDTLFISRPSDTVYLQKDRLKLKYVKLLGDTVWISAECDSLTVIKEVPVTVTKVLYAPDKGLRWWHWLLLWLLSIVVLHFVMRWK